MVAATRQRQGAQVGTDFQGPLVAGIVTLVILFLCVFGWMAGVSISGAVVATGTVIVRGKPKAVQHLDGGIVKEIAVRNGQVVKAGDVLVRLEDTMLKANLEIYRNRLREALARKARLEAERDGAAEISFDDALGRGLGLGEDAVHRGEQRKLFEARWANRASQIERQLEIIRRYGNQIVGVQGLISAKSQQLALVEKELAGLKTLASQGHASEVRVMAKQRERADLAGQISEHRAELARIENSIQETEIAIRQIEHAFKESVLSELRDVSTQVDDLKQQIVATTKQLERVDIRAPVGGVVHELQVHTVGGVVPPGGSLMQIIAVDEGVEVEVAVEPQHIDQVHIGQQAAIRFPAFNQRTTPEIFGWVDVVSPSSVVDERSGAAFYRIGITIPPNEKARLADIELIPGMPVEAHIQTTPRTVLSYVVKPITDQFQRALRE